MYRRRPSHAAVLQPIGLGAVPAGFWTYPKIARRGRACRARGQFYQRLNLDVVCCRTESCVARADATRQNPAMQISGTIFDWIAGLIAMAAALVLLVVIVTLVMTPFSMIGGAIERRYGKAT